MRAELIVGMLVIFKSGFSIYFALTSRLFYEFIYLFFFFLFEFFVEPFKKKKKEKQNYGVQRKEMLNEIKLRENNNK